jgi:predicted AAA+ superfamily ATPase
MASEFPVIVLTGPRQAGKTTLLQHVFADRMRYVSLDVPDVRASALADPRAFLALHSPPVIFDEVQHTPELLPYIRSMVDARRDTPGQFVLSGSQNLLLMRSVSETLAGRAGILRLLPLSLREAVGRPSAPMPWDGIATTTPACAYVELWAAVVRGLYPEIVAHPERDAERWHASYVQTYLERDVRGLRQIADLSLFQSYVQALAARTGQLLNVSEIARDIGVSAATCRAWLSVLEATHQIILVRPYFRNIGRRLVKSPKLYFLDTGTVCYLTGISRAEQAMHGPMAGALFETLVVSEALKAALHNGHEPRIYHWRTADGAEVDIVLDQGDRLVPIEAKASATPRPQMASGIRRFSEAFGKAAAPGFVVHPGDITLPLGQHAMAVPFGV